MRFLRARVVADARASDRFAKAPPATVSGTLCVPVPLKRATPARALTRPDTRTARRTLFIGLRRMGRTGKVIAWVLIAASALLSVINVRSSFVRMQAPTAPSALLSEWREYAAVGQRIGPPTAALTIVVFNDYECEACRQFANAATMLRQRWGDSLSIVVRHLPLSPNSAAQVAARSAICAGQQGHFAEIHSALFSAQDSLNTVSWATMARGVGVTETPRFLQCLDDSTTSATLHRDYAAAERLGTSLTPTLLVGSRLYRGMPSDLDRVVAAAMREVLAGQATAVD